MPIGDLLAQISGEPSKPSSSPPLPRPSGLLKRKADDNIPRSEAAKTQRTDSRAAGATDKPASTPYRGTAGTRPLSSVRPSSTASKKPNGSVSSVTGKPVPPNTASPTAKPKAPLKKGSYAEIMARAQKAQSTMGQVGKIQHKVTEKAPLKKARPDGESDSKEASKRSLPRFNRTIRPGQGADKNSTGRAGQSKDIRAAAFTNGTKERGRDEGRKQAKVQGAAAAEAEDAKKVKKAATATTGYTGTARPRPGASSSKKPSAPGGALLNPRVGSRYSGTGRGSRYDDEDDEDMDDFIDYDDEEEDDGRGARYRYDSGSESDMEAGMDDIYEEERRAEAAAKREDMLQEQIERRLKAEKEERKRKFYDSQRNRS